MSSQFLERPAIVTVSDDESDNRSTPNPSQLDHRTSAREVAATTTLQAAMPYRIGAPDIECRYPVIIGEDQVIGRAHRWHRDWLVDTSVGEHNLRRPPTGVPGIEMAATHLTQEYAAGRITAVPLDQLRAERPSRSTVRCPCCTRGCPSPIATSRARRWRSRDSRPTAGRRSSPVSRAPITTGFSLASCARGRAQSSGATCAGATAPRRAPTATKADASARTASVN